MHHLPSPLLSLSTSFRRSRSPKSNSDISNSNSTTTSPPSSPTSNRSSSHNAPHHFFNLAFHPTKAHNHTFRDKQPDHRAGHTDSIGNFEPSDARRRPVSDIPHGHNTHNSISAGECAVLRGRSSMILRRRLSKIDLALSEERSRCNEDSIERQGLGLMEPRPVDVRVGEAPPNFVMGGIFEVMEGRA
ncbi:hypothetical protein N7457_000631 [Penicillium paradoxum]|uniref:uncharacterized protein n=1 Tax=Penicillium paradoxum TaxID=176176 RepID=UPI002546B9FD|nr:uncharacterized protein N7457_000631 [Penicillium paradoxum]KAJ5794032.1 hypothetical protein N7457_000631 [Penicillium paradoxum]